MDNPVPPPVIYKFLTFPGKIHLITNDHELLAVIGDLQQARELGFDTETRPSFKKGEVYNVAILQLSTEDQAYVIRFGQISQFEVLKNIFENSEVVKVGVAIRDDLKQLQKRFQFVPQNFIELQHVAKTKGLKNMGLKGMTEEVLGATISKGPKTTNWEHPVLTDRQIMYAATDAWIGLTLYQKLK
ncbi:histidine kinase [Bdellovibrio sp. qaytius]|nr:histidine kinase [Bdellovibrio sp. qaytius]